MLRAEEDIPKEVTFESGPASTSLLRIIEAKKLSQMYSRVVQVFALLTIETFLNEYGYL